MNKSISLILLSVFSALLISGCVGPGLQPTACIEGQTQNCTIDGCPGTQACVNDTWAACVKTDPTCGVISIACVTGQTQVCTIEGCAGTKRCINNDWSPCIKTDPMCGVQAEEMLASGSAYGTIIVWNVSSGVAIKTLTEHVGAVLSMAWSPDGAMFASGASVNFRNWTAEGPIVKIWDTSSWTCINNLTEYTLPVNTIAWSPDGSKLASGSDEDTIKIWDTSSWTAIKTLEAGKNVYSVAWSPDGSKLASGSLDRIVRIWDVSSWSIVKNLTSEISVESVAWSPDGSMLAVNGIETVLVWDLSSESVIKNLTGHTGNVVSVAWSPDSSKIASSSIDRRIIIWDATMGNIIGTLEDTGRPVAWSPDSSKIASSSYDNKVKIWDVSTGGLTKVLIGHTEAILSITWKSRVS